MRKIFNILLLLFLLFYAYQFAFVYLSKGHSIQYSIVDKKYSLDVNETFRRQTKSNDDNYSITINAYGDIFNYLIYDDFNRQSRIVKNVKYYIDKEYSCLFVKYSDNRILSDVVCKKDGFYYPFSNIEKPSNELLNFISSLTQYGYYIKDFKDNFDESYKLDNIEVYKSNFNNDHFIGLKINDLLYRIAINKQNEKIKLYNYRLKIGFFLNNYFTDAIYKDDAIEGFYIYNINDGKSNELKTHISQQSYYLGGYGNDAYIYDPSTHIEYEINLKDKSIIEVGNQETGIKYYSDGKWLRTSYDDFEVNNIQFDKINKTNYVDYYFDYISQTDKEYGYYYFFKKTSDNQYQVYRASVQTPENKMYLFNTTDINSVRYIQNDLYYKFGDKLKYYSDKTSNRIILSSPDLAGEFDYNVFKKIIDKK